MPIFEFTCQKCGHAFEELLARAAFKPGAVKCPACSSPRVERGFSTFAQNAGNTTNGPTFGGGGCGKGSGGFT